MTRKSRPDGFFRALLRLFPAEFRGDFGNQMTDDFRDQQQEAARRRGPFALLRLCARTVIDLIRRAPQEHLDVIRRDAAYAVRVLRRRPASSATVVLSLAIGIGLNTALFSVVSGVLWRSLPFPGSDRLVRMYEIDARAPERTADVTAGNLIDLRDQTHALLSVGAGAFQNQTIVAPGEPEEIPGMVVTDGFFETLGARPVLGRPLTSFDYESSASLDLNAVTAVADRLKRQKNGEAPPTIAIVISQALWQRRFLGRPDVIGQKLRLASGVAVEIVGVMGPEMASLSRDFGPGAEWWIPQAPRRARAGTLVAIGRLGPGVSLAAAQAELDVIGGHLASTLPQSARGRSFRAVRMLDTIVKNVRSELMFLFGAVLCVLLVTCVNVVHLFLANAAGRRVELATRVALGATRGHLIRQTLTESALFAAMGGAGGVLLAAWTVPLLVSIAPAGIPRLNEIHIDWVTFAFAAAVSLGVALFCGLAASLPLTMLKPWDALGTARSGRTIHGRRVRRALAVCEIAVALMLVVASMLMVRTVRTLAMLDLGFDPRGVIAASMPRPIDPAVDAGGLVRMHEIEAAFIEEVQQLPGVIAAGVGGSPLGLMAGLGGVRIPGDDRDFGMTELQAVSTGYFEALGARLISGRFFNRDDRAGAPTVAIVSVSAAKKFWPSESAVGKTLTLPASGAVRVVGVVADMAEWELATKGGGIFLPHVQSSYVTGGAMLIRTDRDPQSLVPAIKTIVRRVNPEQPFPGVTPLQDQIDLATAPRRFILQLVGIFSALGVALAVLGIYGVLAESVAERVPEIGVRIAMGARPSDVLGLILWQGARIVLVGLGVGLIGAFLLRHQMATMVFGVPTADPISYAAACAALLIAACSACAIPAHRATRLDPVVALRTD